jgi:hypothetical protein
MAQPRSRFGPDTPVLWMDPQPPRHALGERHLLWPAWSYVVVAPRVQPRRRSLNILEQSVLGLLAAGMHSAYDLQRALHLELELVTYIRDDLIERALCDGSGALTAKGELALRERTERHAELCRGFVFREPTTGMLWGRFVEQPRYAEIEWRGRVPWLVYGPRGSGDSRQVLRIFPPSSSEPPRTPRPDEVLREIDRHRRALAGGDPNVSPAAVAPEQRARIEIVRETAEPIWLAVPLYATRAEDDGAPWHACDPFGVGSSPPLREAIERRAREDGMEELAELLEALAGEAAARRDSRAERIRRALVERFGDALAQQPGLQGALIDMQLAVAAAARDAGETVDARARVRRVLEDALRGTLGEAGPELASDLLDERDQDHALIAAHAEALGFELSSHALRGVSAEDVRAVASGRGGGALALLAANVLAAALDPAHPLRALAARCPALPALIGALAADPDPDAPGWDRAARQAELEHLCDEALDVVECALTTRATCAMEA